MYGLIVRGNTDQLIVGDDYPVLTQRYKGDIVITQVPPQNGEMWYEAYTGDVSAYCVGGRGYGYCDVTYPSPINSTLPPLVFAVPTGSANDKGLGFFCHRGSPGNWAGFSVLVTPTLFAQNGATTTGVNSGWTYRVCVFGDPGFFAHSGTHGLRMFAANGTPTFDSRWPIVPFRGLLGAWQLEGFTRYYNIDAYWGRRLVGGDDDAVLVKGKHVWGAADGTLGFLLSGLGCIPLRHDIGSDDYTHSAVVTMGFPDGGRSHIWAVAYEGLSQHPNGNVSAMSNWRLLTADFSLV